MLRSHELLLLGTDVWKKRLCRSGMETMICNGFTGNLQLNITWQLVTIETILPLENSYKACYLVRPPNLIALNLQQRY